MNSNLSCSEWFSISVYSDTLDKILNANTLTGKLKGKEKNKYIKLNPTQLKGMQNTIRLYRAFGG